MISLLGRERKLKRGSAKQRNEPQGTKMLRTSLLPTALCWGHLGSQELGVESCGGPPLRAKGHPCRRQATKQEQVVGRREVRAGGDKAKTVTQ